MSFLSNLFNSIVAPAAISSAFGVGGATGATGAANILGGKSPTENVGPAATADILGLGAAPLLAAGGLGAGAAAAAPETAGTGVFGTTAIPPSTVPISTQLGWEAPASHFGTAGGGIGSIPYGEGAAAAGVGAASIPSANGAEISIPEAVPPVDSGVPRNDWMFDPSLTGAAAPALGTGGGVSLNQLLTLATAGKLGAGVLGLIGASQKAKEQKRQQDEFAAQGAPYRAQLAELYANPEKYLSSPAVTEPIQQGTTQLARSLSTQGNPTGSGNALQAIQNYASTKLSGALGEEKNRLAALSGIQNYNAAAPGASQSTIDAKGGIYNVLGGTLYDVTNPQPSLEEILKRYGIGGGIYRTANA